MGLTLHFSLNAGSLRPGEARKKLELLRQRALEMSFEHVGEFVELHGSACDFNNASADDTNRPLLAASLWQFDDSETGRLDVPNELVAFSVEPRRGSERAVLGLARHSDGVWSLTCSCKTQYASNPTYGGVENFLAAHMSLVSLLDCANGLRLLGWVKDESGYWDHRDPVQLAESLAEWNGLTAKVAGQTKDLFGSSVKAEILKYQNFEHLEAKARLPKESP